MTSYSGGPDQIPLTTAGFGTRHRHASRPTLYEEGPWVYKRNGLVLHRVRGQVLLGVHRATPPRPARPGRGPTAARSCPRRAAASPTTRAIVDYKGSSYFFYHNGALPGGGGFTRSVAVEKFAYNADGTIPTINMTTTGPPQVGTLNPLRPPGGRDDRLGIRGRDRTVSAKAAWTSAGSKTATTSRSRASPSVPGAPSFTARVASAHRRRHDRAAPGQSERHGGGHVHRAGHRRLADLDHGVLPGQRRHRHPGPVPAGSPAAAATCST